MACTGNLIRRINCQLNRTFMDVDYDRMVVNVYCTERS